jgi:crossover junction endodeoxyribonuclease RuvC
MIKSLGIDLSTSATGVILLCHTEKSPAPGMADEIKPSKGLKGMARNREIVTRLMEIITAEQPDRIVLEGYGLNTQHASSIIPLVELGGLLRFMLHLDGHSWLDPRPSEIKKFATGKGNSPKDVVMMHVLKRWGFESATNNIADAFVCAAMGLAHMGKLEMPKDLKAIATNLTLVTE